MNNEFNIDAFKELPCNLKKSDYVDILLLLCGLKPCVRLGCNETDTLRKMEKWCKDNNYKFCKTRENYFYVSKNMIFAFVSMKIDNSLFNHTYILGRLFGYPRCCCKKIKMVGENNIDEWEHEFCKKTTFVKDYRLINPSNYTEGSSFVSHIPCSGSCKKSLIIAKQAFSVVDRYKDSECFIRWKNWFD